jgi:hypothetical protein
VDAAVAKELDAADPVRRRWTGGHGDLVFAFVDGSLQTFVDLDSATVDGVPGRSLVLGLDEVVLRSAAKFTRPVVDAGFFAPLCVEPGAQVAWLPQGNADAHAHGAPFAGLRVDVPAGMFVGDGLNLVLEAVATPAGAGAYTLWQDAFPPRFLFTSCDGISTMDAFDHPLGHDHFNMAFSEPGRWVITIGARGEVRATGQVHAVTARLHVDLVETP